MNTTWILRTRGDPVGKLRKFIEDLWNCTHLEGVLTPVYRESAPGVYPELLENPDQLAAADPFVPFVPVNSAAIVRQISNSRPDGRFAAILRSCETRAVLELSNRGSLIREGWLILGVDCLGSFPAAEFEWRQERIGDVEDLTRESLRFARQGGIAAYRYRRACQVCASPVPPEVDLTIGLLGLPVRDVILVKARDEDLSQACHLPQITDGEAKPALIKQRERMIARIKLRGMVGRERAWREVPVDLPTTVNALIRHLAGCKPCHKCLDACALYEGELEAGDVSETPESERVERWLAACVGCGMCDQACPKYIPLSIIIGRIQRSLKNVAVASTGYHIHGGQNAVARAN